MKNKIKIPILILLVTFSCISCISNLPGKKSGVTPTADTESATTEVIPEETPAFTEEPIRFLGTQEWITSGTTREIPPGTTFTSPWDYCGAIGTIDKPGPEYTGEASHPEIHKQVQMALARSAADGAGDNIIWRCADGSVYGCNATLSQDCLTQMDLSHTPAEAAISECAKAEMNLQTLPSAVVGRETPYEWICQEGKPIISGQGISVDEQGYNSMIWFNVVKP